MNYLNNYFSLLLNNKAQAQQAQQAEAKEENKVNSSNGVNEASAPRAFGSMTMPNVNLQNSPEQDSFNNSKAGFNPMKLMETVPALYMLGFAIGVCPKLALVSTCLFLFSNKGQTFKEQMGMLLSQNGYAQQLQQAFNNNNQAQQNVQQTQNVQQPQQTAQKPQNVQQAQPAEQTQERSAVEEQTVTNPIENKEPAKAEEKPMTPMEKAQARYDKAQDYQTKAELNLIKKEEAHNIAKDKLATAEAKLAKAQEEYDNAKSQVKIQMTERMTRLNQSVDVKRANLAIAKEKEDIARAVLEEAQIKVSNAQQKLETLKANEMVDTTL